MDKDIIVAVVGAVIGSNALWGFIQFLVQRKDKKEDCSQKIIEMIKKIDEKFDKRVTEIDNQSTQRNKRLDAKIDESISKLDDRVTRWNEKLDKKIDKLDDELTERGIVACRVRILKFMDEILEGWQHSKDSYNQVIQDITNYERYCAEHPLFKNHQAVAAIEHIKSDYQERLEKNDFRVSN